MLMQGLLTIYIDIMIYQIVNMKNLLCFHHDSPLFGPHDTFFEILKCHFHLFSHDIVCVSKGKFSHYAPSTMHGIPALNLFVINETVWKPRNLCLIIKNRYVVGYDDTCLERWSLSSSNFDCESYEDYVYEFEVISKNWLFGNPT